MRNHIENTCRVADDEQVTNWEKGLEIKFPGIMKDVYKKRKANTDHGAQPGITTTKKQRTDDMGQDVT